MSVMEETRPTTASAPAPTGSMNVMDASGHTRVTWNKNVPTEVAIAKAAYEQAVKGGAQGFSVRSDGSQGRRLDSFDPNAEEIMMVPRLQGG